MVSLERERKLQGCFRCLVGCLDKKKYPSWSGRGGVFVTHDKEWIKWIGSHRNARDDAKTEFPRCIRLGINAIRRLHGRRQCKINLRLASRVWA